MGKISELKQQEIDDNSQLSDEIEEALMKLDIVIKNPTLNPLQKGNIESFRDDLSSELMEVEEKTKIYYSATRYVVRRVARALAVPEAGGLVLREHGPAGRDCATRAPVAWGGGIRSTPAPGDLTRRPSIRLLTTIHPEQERERAAQNEKERKKG